MSIKRDFDRMRQEAATRGDNCSSHAAKNIYSEHHRGKLHAIVDPIWAFIAREVITDHKRTTFLLLLSHCRGFGESSNSIIFSSMFRTNKYAKHQKWNWPPSGTWKWTIVQFFCLIKLSFTTGFSDVEQFFCLSLLAQWTPQETKFWKAFHSLRRTTEAKNVKRIMN